MLNENAMIYENTIFDTFQFRVSARGYEDGSVSFALSLPGLMTGLTLDAAQVEELALAFKELHDSMNALTTPHSETEIAS